VLRFAVRDHMHAAGEYAVDHERSSITGGWRPLPGKLDPHIGKRPHRWGTVGPNAPRDTWRSLRQTMA
jgi:hypothetical protein